jgi:hypothetical protein
VLRFREKGGKEREIPVRHDMEAAGLGAQDKNAPLLQSAEAQCALPYLQRYICEYENRTP